MSEELDGPSEEARTHLDLFSGIGGFALAAAWNGVRTVGFCETDSYARQILKERFGAVADTDGGRAAQPEGSEQNERGRAGNGGAPLHGDIATLRGADYLGVWLVTGGFPCQPFSVAGKRRGAGDDRALWPQMFRIISEARPAWVLGENVPGIVNMELERVLSDLEGEGYAVRAAIVPACAVDAKHRRDRVWIVANASCGRFGGAGDGQGELAGRSKAIGASKAVANANGEGLQKHEGLSQRSGECAPGPCGWADESGWFAQSGLGRVAHGVSNRAHRLRALGNAIVPQVAAELIRCMIRAEAIYV